MASTVTVRVDPGEDPILLEVTLQGFAGRAGHGGGWQITATDTDRNRTRGFLEDVAAGVLYLTGFGDRGVIELNIEQLTTVQITAV